MKNEQITAKTAKESISNTDMMFAVTFDGTVIARLENAVDGIEKGIIKVSIGFKKNLIKTISDMKVMVEL
jgi:hypothetical protein